MANHFKGPLRLDATPIRAEPTLTKKNKLRLRLLGFAVSLVIVIVIAAIVTWQAQQQLHQLEANPPAATAE